MRGDEISLPRILIFGSKVRKLLFWQWVAALNS